MPFARKGDGRPHGAPRRARRAGREGAAPPDRRRRRASASPSWSGRAPSVAPSCRAPTPRRSASCVGSAACSRRFTSTAAAPTARRRRPPSPPFAPLSTGSPAAARGRGDRQEGRHVEDRGAQEQGLERARSGRLHRRRATAGGDGEKVEHRGALNLLNIDHDGQVQEMIDLAEVARRSPQPVQHWILSWREGEQPTRAQADEAVGMFLARDGPRRAPGDLCASPRHP